MLSCSGLRGECREKACFPRLKRDLRTEKWTLSLSEASIWFSLDFYACAFGSVLFRIALQRLHEASRASTFFSVLLTWKAR